MASHASKSHASKSFGKLKVLAKIIFVRDAEKDAENFSFKIWSSCTISNAYKWNGVYVGGDRSALEGAINNLLRTTQQSHK